MIFSTMEVKEVLRHLKVPRRDQTSFFKKLHKPNIYPFTLQTKLRVTFEKNLKLKEEVQFSVR